MMDIYIYIYYLVYCFPFIMLPAIIELPSIYLYTSCSIFTHFTELIFTLRILYSLVFLDLYRQFD